MESEIDQPNPYGGYPPHGYPPNGYPPYGYPPYGYGYPQPPTGTNGLAIAALVLGICGFLFVTPIIGLVFGIVSLSAVRKSGQKGKGLAVSGIVLSSAWIAVFATIITIAVVDTPDPARRNADGTVVSPGAVSVFGLHPKDCFTLPPGAFSSPDAKTTTLKVVPCSTAHDSEAFGSFMAAEGSFPGADDLLVESTSQCVQRLTSFLPDPGSLAAGSRVQYIYPDQQAWDHGERRVTCFLQFPAATMTRSVYRAASAYTADQLRFLNAYNPLSEAVGELSVTSDSADISVMRQRAADVANAAQGEVSALTAQPWPPAVQPSVDALVADHTAAARIWAQVEGSTDVATFTAGARRANAAFSVPDLMAVRNALGLTTGAAGSGGGTSQTA